MFIFYITAFVPESIENIYSRGINKLLIEVLSLATGIIPFSIAEIGLLVLAVLIPIILILKIIRIIRQRNERIKATINLIIDLLIVSSIIYFIFTAFWSLNYNRLSFGEMAKLDTKPATLDELAGLCNSLVDRANSLRVNVSQNSKGLMFIPGGCSYVFKNADKGYSIEAKTFPFLGGSYGRPKAVIFSKAMSYFGITGVYCPFTGEANIDADIPDFSMPSATCHEMAHQHGFAREDEANYIAWLTCEANPDVSFQYSGAILALINSMNALYSYDKEKYLELSKKLSDGVNRDLDDNQQYWQKHKGQAEKIVTSLNDTYLKASKQKDGVHSYGRMVDLLIAEYRKYQI